MQIRHALFCHCVSELAIVDAVEGWPHIQSGVAIIGHDFVNNWWRAVLVEIANWRNSSKMGQRDFGEAIRIGCQRRIFGRSWIAVKNEAYVGAKRVVARID